MSAKTVLRCFICVWLIAEAAVGNVLGASAKREYQIHGMVPYASHIFEQQWAGIRDYLNVEVGHKFDPVISFTLRGEDGYDLSPFESDLENQDFVFTHPNMIGCLDAEFRLSPVLTLRTIRGGVGGLNQFGTVVFVSKNRTDLQTIADLKDKVVSASTFGLLEQQWRTLDEKGVSLFADTAQVRFAERNDSGAIDDVLMGRTDAAFAHTNVVESAAPALRAQLRVLEPLADVQMLDGAPYPFLTTSELFPEFGLLAGEHVGWEVQREVVVALLRLSASSPALAAAGIEAFQPALSYSPARDLYEQLGLMALDPARGRWRCGQMGSRAGSIWEAIACPAGKYKLPPHKVAVGCEEAGLACPGGFQCVCRPCIRGQEVDLFLEEVGAAGGGAGPGAESRGEECVRMETCAHVTQNQLVSFRVHDNLLREAGEVTWRLHEHSVARTGTAVAVHAEGEGGEGGGGEGGGFLFEYSFSVASSEVGVHLVEVLLEGSAIAASPLILDVTEAECREGRVANRLGDCVCGGSALAVGGDCVSLAALLGGAVLVFAVLVVAALLVYFHLKRRHDDALWLIEPADLHFTSPPEVLGRGTFGLVVAAEYRKTAVAVKRVIPPSAAEGIGETVSKHVRRMSRHFTGEADEHHAQMQSVFALPPAPSSSSSHGTASASASASASFPLPPSLPGTLPPLPALPSVSNLPSLSVPSSPNTFVSPLSRRGSASVWPSEAAVMAAAGPPRGSRGWRSRVGALVGCLQASEKARMRRDFVAEMRVLAKMRHPCITTVMGAVVKPGHEPMLVMEMMEHGSLLSLVTNPSVELTGELVLPILRHVAQGMSFLHHHPLVHGDLKAANVLVDAQFRGKVADFGLTARRRDGGKAAAAGPVGTPFWMAPELLRGEPNTAESDVYAFGITLWECYARGEPYAGEEASEVLRAVADARAGEEGWQEDKRPEVPRQCPAEAAAVMKACWHRDPALRPPFDEVLRMLQALNTRTMGPTTPSEQAQGGTRHEGVLKRQESATGRRVLYDVFPKHIADRLLAGQKVDPEHRSEVTIFFSDIVGFTTIAATQCPAKVSDMLDRLYTRLDEVSQRLRVFKVETIGDAYMAVTNLVEDQPSDHCLRIARFATEAIDAAAATLIDPEDLSLGSINLRVGLHSGPVVANVVGSRNPRYCLFGDTVNTASRMESNSMPGQIHCSERCAKILKKQLGDSANKAVQCPLQIKSRGEMDIKGKGKMHTFWISVPRPDAPLERASSASLAWDTVPARNSSGEPPQVEQPPQPEQPEQPPEPEPPLPREQPHNEQ